MLGFGDFGASVIDRLLVNILTGWVYYRQKHNANKVIGD